MACTTHVDWPLVVDFLKSAIGSLAWPSLIGLIICLFRPQIANHLEQVRLSKVEALGTNLEFIQSTAPISTKETAQVSQREYNALALKHNQLYFGLVVTTGILLETWRSYRQIPQNAKALFESFFVGAENIKKNSPELYLSSPLPGLEAALKKIK